MMYRFFTLFLTLFLSVLLSGGLFAARNVMTCDWCGKKIASNASFLRSEDKNFCSEKCFNAYAQSLLPVCDVCGRRFKQGFTSDGKNYCSKACLETTFHECIHCHRREPRGVILGNDIFLCDYCRELPACSSCQMPLDKFAKDLGDGRSLCRECARDAIFTQTEAERIMTALRQKLADKFKMGTKHAIQFDLCTREELKKESSGDGERELGLFIFHRNTLTFFNRPIRSKDEFRILILRGQPPDFFRGVGAHELAHDWMQENLPHIDDPQIREGFAEFVAWLYAKTEKLDRVPWRMEQNTDPVYGDGFRKVRDLMGDAKTASEWKQILLNVCPAPREVK
jgi:hypothetical protein